MIDKLENRDKINNHKISDKLNEIIDFLNKVELDVFGHIAKSDFKIDETKEVYREGGFFTSGDLKEDG